MTQLQHFSSKQILFKELFVGALIYAVVLGFLDDYTGIVKAKSFSTIFFSAIVLQLLTISAFMLKKRLIAYFKARKGKWAKVGMVFSVWLVMFLSKFVFIGALDLLFRNYISIKGFFGILLVVVLVTVIHNLADHIFNKLADTR